MHVKCLSLFCAIMFISSSIALEKPRQTREPGVVYVGTPYDVIAKMLQMANVHSNDVVYDLGCGDGRMLVLAAKKYGCRGMGYEIDPEQVAASLENVARNGVEKLVKIVQADIFTVDLQEATVIPLYLSPVLHKLLLPQLDRMKPGSRIICHNYDLEGIVPDAMTTYLSNEDNSTHILWLYTTPLKRKQEQQ